MDETSMLWGSLVLCVAIVAGSILFNNVHKHDAMVKAIQAGGDPLAVRCAFDAEGLDHTCDLLSLQAR